MMPSPAVRTIRLLLACFIGCAPCCTTSLRADEMAVYADGPKIGDPAPPLHLVKMLNGPLDKATNWSALRGKVVVLDFWATWCMPCIVSIPHMNKLEEELKNDPVKFIAITAEPESVVTNFLQHNPLLARQAELIKSNPKVFQPLMETLSQADPIKSWIGLDDLTGHAADDYYAGNTVSGYYFQGVPHCVVVDKEGRIAAYVHPLQLNAAYLRAIAAGEHPPEPDPDLAPNELKAWHAQMTKRKLYAPPSPRPATYEVSIQRSREWLPPKDGGFFSNGAANTEFRRNNSTLADTLDLLQQSVPGLRFEILSPLPAERYDFRFNTPKDLFVGLLEQSLRVTFNLDIQQTVGQKEIYVCKAVPRPNNPPAAPPQKTPDTFTIDGAKANLVYFALQRFGKTLIDQGEVEKGTSDSLTLNKAADFAAFQQAVREQMGLELVSIKQPVQVLQIRSRQK